MKVALLGHRGMLGTHYKRLLHAHPWFQLHPVESVQEACSFPLVLTAVPDHAASSIEKYLVEQKCKVISSSAAHRHEQCVPLLIPEVNCEDLQILDKQDGWIVTKPNCTVHTFVLPLTPLHRAFTITALSITSMQALSGGGYRLLKQSHLKQQVSTHIPGEEKKCIEEPKKIWNCPNLTIAAQCNRVPVAYGHVVFVQVSFSRRPLKEEIIECWESFSPLTLPSSPHPLISYHDEDLPPLPENGMTIQCAKLRPSPHFDFSFITAANNVVRGGSGAGILIAELLHKEGYLV